jgi:hypothetical protein
VPLHTEASDLRQDIDNNEHATGRRVDLTGGAEEPVGEGLGKNVQFVAIPRGNSTLVFGAAVN